MTGLVRGLVKRVTELALVGSGAAARARRRNTAHVAVLAYHNVVPGALTGRGDTSLHLSFDDFRRQLDRLQRTHRVVGLGALEAGSDGGSGGGSDGDVSHAQGLDGGEETRGGIHGRAEDAPTTARPRAALTFDDAYRGALRHAVPELVRRGLPATVFVCPGLLGSEGFWWDRVADTRSGPGPERRHHALEELGGRQREVLAAWAAGTVPEDYRPADADEVRALAREPGMTVASHTWSHPRLTALEDQDLRRELVRAREWLSREAPEAFLPGHLTFPYGLWDDRVAAVVREVGHRFLYRVEGGPTAVSGGGGVLSRVNVPAGVSVRGFELRASGVLG